MKILKGGLDNLEGVRSAGIKEGKYGLALIAFDGLCPAEGVFTTNKMEAAPVKLSRERVKDGLRAIVANSGNANCSTGERGFNDAEKIAAKAAELLGISEESVAVASTGLIGKYLDRELIERQLDEAFPMLGKNSGDAAKAIITTDTKPKELCMDFGDFKIAGISKGSGMIHPNMATMLCFIATDAVFPKGVLKKAVDASFNMMSIDNDMSTNDMVLLVSAGDKKVNGFEAALTEFCQEMARLMVEDGEGATKLIEIEVSGAKSIADAKKAARAIADSYLVKTAAFGNNPNWGRVSAAVGYSGAEMKEENMKIWYEVSGAKTLLYDGFAKEFDKTGLGKEMEKADSIRIIVDLGLGEGSAKAWTCDLSFGYVKINAEYN
jgi:glutamate N-acetyltransferase / amino-acid N-acetyltransferase